MNLPNKLTVSRLAMTMIFVGFACVPATNPYHLACWRTAYVLAVIAGLTDFFDGYLARRLNLITDFGKLMDPLSDKIFTVSCFVILTAHELVPAWVTVLILAREFAVTGLRAVAAKSGEVVAARELGKLKTVLQMLILAVGGWFWARWGWVYLDVKTEAPTLLYWTWQALLWAITGITVYSGFDYFWKSRHLYLKDM